MTFFKVIFWRFLKDHYTYVYITAKYSEKSFNFTTLKDYIIHKYDFFYKNFLIKTDRKPIKRRFRLRSKKILPPILHVIKLFSSLKIENTRFKIYKLQWLYEEIIKSKILPFRYIYILPKIKTFTIHKYFKFIESENLFFNYFVYAIYSNWINFKNIKFIDNIAPISKIVLINNKLIFNKKKFNPNNISNYIKKPIIYTEDVNINDEKKLLIPLTNKICKVNIGSFQSKSQTAIIDLNNKFVVTNQIGNIYWRPLYIEKIIVHYINNKYLSTFISGYLGLISIYKIFISESFLFIRNNFVRYCFYLFLPFTFIFTLNTRLQNIKHWLMWCNISIISEGSKVAFYLVETFIKHTAVCVLYKIYTTLVRISNSFIYKVYFIFNYFLNPKANVKLFLDYAKNNITHDILIISIFITTISILLTIDYEDYIINFTYIQAGYTICYIFIITILLAFFNIRKEFAYCIEFFILWYAFIHLWIVQFRRSKFPRAGNYKFKKYLYETLPTDYFHWPTLIVSRLEGFIIHGNLLTFSLLLIIVFIVWSINYRQDLLSSNMENIIDHRDDVLIQKNILFETIIDDVHPKYDYDANDDILPYEIADLQSVYDLYTMHSQPSVLEDGKKMFNDYHFVHWTKLDLVEIALSEIKSDLYEVEMDDYEYHYRTETLKKKVFSENNMYYQIKNKKHPDIDFDWSYNPDDYKVWYNKSYFLEDVLDDVIMPTVVCVWNAEIYDRRRSKIYSTKYNIAFNEWIDFNSSMKEVIEAFPVDGASYVKDYSFEEDLTADNIDSIRLLKIRKKSKAKISEKLLMHKELNLRDNSFTRRLYYNTLRNVIKLSRAEMNRMKDEYMNIFDLVIIDEVLIPLHYEEFLAKYSIIRQIIHNNFYDYLAPNIKLEICAKAGFPFLMPFMPFYFDEGILYEEDYIDQEDEAIEYGLIRSLWDTNQAIIETDKLEDDENVLEIYEANPSANIFLQYYVNYYEAKTYQIAKLFLKTNQLYFKIDLDDKIKKIEYQPLLGLPKPTE